MKTVRLVGTPEIKKGRQMNEWMDGYRDRGIDIQANNIKTDRHKDR
jgi:hypothetical protein